MSVQMIGYPLPLAQQTRIQNEIYDENEGYTLNEDALMLGLDSAGKLITPEVVAYEKAHAAYVEKGV